MAPNFRVSFIREVAELLDKIILLLSELEKVPETKGDCELRSLLFMLELVTAQLNNSEYSSYGLYVESLREHLKEIKASVSNLGTIIDACDEYQKTRKY